jgi:hypothetical protein
MDWRHEHELASGGGNSNKQSRKLLAGRILDWQMDKVWPSLHVDEFDRQAGHTRASVRDRAHRAIELYVPFCRPCEGSHRHYWRVQSMYCLCLLPARFWAHRRRGPFFLSFFLFHSTPLHSLSGRLSFRFSKPAEQF